MFQTRVFAFLVSLLLGQIWVQLFRIMLMPTMLIGVALILIFVGAVAAWNAWQLQVYSLTLYFTVFVCGVSAVLTGVMGILYALVKSYNLCRCFYWWHFLSCSEISKTCAHIEHKLIAQGCDPCKKCNP